MPKKKPINKLPPMYNFSLNPYPDLRFWKCPDCNNKTGQRKLPLLIHIDPQNLIALGYINRYCKYCDMLIGHQHEIEHHLTDLFLKKNPDVIGNRYLIVGTVEKTVWRQNMKGDKSFDEMLDHFHYFKSFQTLRMTAGGWFPKDMDPPVMTPPPSQEWVK